MRKLAGKFRDCWRWAKTTSPTGGGSDQWWKTNWFWFLPSLGIGFASLAMGVLVPPQELARSSLIVAWVALGAALFIASRGIFKARPIAYMPCGLLACAALAWGLNALFVHYKRPSTPIAAVIEEHSKQKTESSSTNSSHVGEAYVPPKPPSPEKARPRRPVQPPKLRVDFTMPHNERPSRVEWRVKNLSDEPVMGIVWNFSITNRDKPEVRRGGVYHYMRNETQKIDFINPHESHGGYVVPDGTPVESGDLVLATGILRCPGCKDQGFLLLFREEREGWYAAANLYGVMMHDSLHANAEEIIDRAFPNITKIPIGHWNLIRP